MSNEQTCPDWAKRIPRSVILTSSHRYGLDPDVVMAIIQQESSGNTFATRFEPEAYARGSYFVSPREWATKLLITEVTEKIQQYQSWGLMQLMGFKARELGFTGYFPMLCEPEINVELGCKLLKSLFERYETEEEVISAYNQGSPRKTPGGFFENQKNYVDPVCKFIRELRKEI